MDTILLAANTLKHLLATAISISMVLDRQQSRVLIGVEVETARHFDQISAGSCDAVELTDAAALVIIEGLASWIGKADKSAMDHVW